MAVTQELTFEKSFDQFDSLLDRAAKVPRHVGLALPDSDKTRRTAMFKDMELQRDGKGTGFVTMRVFWEWTLEHTAKVIPRYGPVRGMGLQAHRREGHQGP